MACNKWVFPSPTPPIQEQWVIRRCQILGDSLTGTMRQAVVWTVYEIFKSVTRVECNTARTLRHVQRSAGNLFCLSRVRTRFEIRVGFDDESHIHRPVHDAHQQAGASLDALC